jgi:GTP-binding protein Era
VGKSTLVNALLDFKLSIVTNKPQTTRHRILGILNEDNSQAIFLDTPGLIEAHYKLQEAMINAVTAAINDADVLLLMLDATKSVIDQEFATCKRLLDTKKQVLVAINKCDAVAKNSILPIIDELHRKMSISTILPISALTGDGLPELKNEIVALLPTGPPFYPTDQVTEHPERFFVAEIIREQIFRKYGEEIPYATTVIIETFKERAQGKDYINAKIIVERKSQKAILIGKGGKALKEIGKLARDEIETFLGRKIYLELWVAVREKWRSKDLYLKEFGYK